MINLKTIDNISQSIIGTLKRFPLASFSAFIVTIILISLIELEYYPKDSTITILATKIAFVASLGIILFPTLKLFWSNFLMTLLGVAILVGYYYILPTDITSGGSNIFFRHTLLILATFLMFIWTPFVNVKISNKNIWEWTQNFILVLLSTVVFSLILYLGISLALYVIEKLFNVDIADRRFVQLAVLIFGIYGVNLFLSQIPKYILLLQVRTYTKAEIIFTKYILTPLTVGYFLILLAYSAKILITMQWPSGIVAWISIIFSLVAITTYLFWTPLWEEENIKFKRAIWIAILFQTIMLGVSIWIRVEEYGFTESRYFIALFGAWLVFMSLYFIFVENASYKWLFMSLSILLIASQFGKYSATEVSKRDQLARVQKLIELKENNNTLSPQKKKDIYSKIEYLYNHHNIDIFETITPNIIKKYKDINSTAYFPEFMVKELGIKDIFKQNRNYNTYSIAQNNNIINIQGYQYLIEVDYFYQNKSIYNIDNNLSIKIEDNNISVIKNRENIVNIGLNDILKSINITENKTEILQLDKMIYRYDNSQIKLKLLLKHIEFTDKTVLMMDGYILFSNKK